MKLSFSGRARHVYTHQHPVKRLKWADAKTLRGSVDELGLSGNFFVKAEFEPQELLDWLPLYIEAFPEEAVEVLGSLHSKAIVALHKCGGE